jgi:hypothetical protein
MRDPVRRIAGAAVDAGLGLEVGVERRIGDLDDERHV